MKNDTRSQEPSGQQVSAPRPRGCSDGRAVDVDVHDVGPAPAGMVLRPHRPPWRRRRRPRARGDVPLSVSAWTISRASAPRPRGCSEILRVLDVFGPVGPAPAGMFPVAVRRDLHRGGRPCARGDVPGQRRRVTAYPPSAPRPRGCSLDGSDLLDIVRVGPAPAGMFPPSR